MFKYELRVVIGQAYYYTILDKSNKEFCIVLSDKPATSVKALIEALNARAIG